MKILFTFENGLPSTEADAEVFTATARCLAPFTARSWLHIPASRDVGGLAMIRARAPARPAWLRHVCCGVTLVTRSAFRQADLVYTRNLWIACMSLLFGQRVAFDHYRPWPDQIPPLQPLIRALMCHRRFLVNICHSDYTRGKYLELGIPPGKLVCIRNGYEPARLLPALPVELAKRRIGVPADRPTVVYTGRVNHKKGLVLLIEAASHLPEVLFILVGSKGAGPIETLAASVPNIRLIAWQAPETLAHYLFAADVLIIPPSTRPLAEFGSTVLPLKLFLYMASGRPILAGATPDVGEVLRHGENAFLCCPDRADALVAGLRALIEDRALAARLAATALADSAGLTWRTRAARIADTLGERLRSAPASPRPRTGRARRAWIGHSARWLVHLIRNGSIILPPEDILSARQAAGGRRV